MRALSKFLRSILAFFIVIVFTILLQELLRRYAKQTVPIREENEPIIKFPVKTTSSTTVTKSDDFKKIEGIGPKIATILQAAGIRSFSDLADASVGRIDQILEEAGLIPGRGGTWPEQARLAAEEKWEELKAFQENLRGGLKTS